MLSVALTQERRANAVLTVLAAWLAIPRVGFGADDLAVFDGRNIASVEHPRLAHAELPPSFSSWWREASPWRVASLGAGLSALSSVFRLPLGRHKLSPGSVGCLALDFGVHMRHRNAGLIADPLFIGATRPSMLWGVTYSAVMLNAMCIMELFLLTKNLLILLLAAPIHGVCMLLCARDARFFDLVLLWGVNPAAGASREPSVLEGKQL